VDTGAAEAVADLPDCSDRAQAQIEAEAAFVSRAAHLPTPTLTRFQRLVPPALPAIRVRIDLESLDPEAPLAGALTPQRRHRPHAPAATVTRAVA